MRICHFATLSAASLLLSATFTLAQDRPRANPPAQNPPAQNPPGVNPDRSPPGRPVDQRPDEQRFARPGAASQLDHHLANCLMLGNQEEIAISRWALERIQNPRAKEFAQQMINEHQQALEKLRPFATFEGSVDSVTSNQVRDDRVTINANRPVAPQDDTRQLRPELRDQSQAEKLLVQNTQPGPAGNSLDDQLFQVQRTAAEECLKLTKDCLMKHQGQEFDNAFVGMQIGAHIGMLAKLNASDSAASPELRRVINDAQATTRRHQEHATQLMETLKATQNQGAQLGR